jgi:FixJ family two-component response regulator
MSAKISFLPNAATANRVLSGVPIRSIAIVDDEECVCRAFARLLRAYSYHPQTYRSATEFLQALNEGVPDCLILDVHLGDMNGFDFLRRLTGGGLHIPTIVVTARDEPAVQRDFASCSATALLLKPVGGDVLLKAIETAIGKPDSRDAECRQV